MLAGAGTGGTVAAAGTLVGDFALACAFEPARFRRLRLWGLPAPGGERRELQVTTWNRGDDAAWWRDELAAYVDAGLEGELKGSGAPRSVVRRALGLPAEDDRFPPTMASGTGDPWIFRFEPRFELWDATLELAHRAGHRVVEQQVLWRLPGQLASDEVSGLVLPVPEGPLGGTTLVVLPEDEVSPERREAWRAAWLALDGSDVLAPRGGRHALRVAVQGGDPSPAEVLGELARKNVLIVPATFCASPAEMAGLAAELEAALRDTTASFLPGLGGRLHLAGGPERGAP